jgi:hypothetical protein
MPSLIGELEYEKLCEICNSLLIAPDSSSIRIANPYLHIIRPHPTFLEKYSQLFILKKSWTRYKNLIKAITSIFFDLLKGVFLNTPVWVSSQKLEKNIDYLFISHFVDSQEQSSNEDFYFSDIPLRLTEKGYSVAIILLNHTKLSPIEISKRYQKSVMPRMVLTDNLNFRNEYSLAIEVIKEKYRLYKKYLAAPIGLQKSILKHASLEVLGGACRSNLRISRQVEFLLNHTKPKSILLTYEGHAWERLIFSICKKRSPKTLRIGYQHSAIFKLQNAACRSLGAPYNPDEIWTSGKNSAQYLRAAKSLSNVQIKILGSNRVGDSLKCNNIQINQRKAVCLVIPEGILSEYEILLNFSICCAIEMPEVTFIWRLHPILSIDNLIGKNKAFKYLPKNILLESESLEIAIKKCNLVLYRGSTAVVAALMSNLRPIYLELPGEISIDLLFNLDEIWRPKISNVNQFKCVIEESKNTHSIEMKNSQLALKDYCKNIYSPIDYSIFDRQL